MSRFGRWSSPEAVTTIYGTLMTCKVLPMSPEESITSKATTAFDPEGELVPILRVNESLSESEIPISAVEKTILQVLLTISPFLANEALELSVICCPAVLCVAPEMWATGMLAG